MPPADAVLDDPVHGALTTRHARFAERFGDALRYRPEVSVWACADGASADFGPLARAIGPAGVVAVMGAPLPPGWRVAREFPCLQMVHDDRATDAAGVVPLGPEDVADMLDLTRRTEPGPFLPRTIELGGYVGVRVDGRLVAMAGRRVAPPGWVEISAVCTDPDSRGRGLAARVMQAVTAGIRSEGDRAFLHVLTTNTGAIALYERLGFTVRREMRITAISPPA